MSTAILLIEDDSSIREIVERGLQKAGFEVASVGDGRTALTAFKSGDFDCVVLDIMLPVLDGFEVCREIRNGSQIPIVMLTARGETDDVVMGLEAGADDYVTKPFEMPELIARLRAILRRVSDVQEVRPIRSGVLHADPRAFRASKGGRPLGLTATEFKLFVEFLTHPGQVLTREELLERVWGYDYLGDSRLVDMAVKRLRKKIENDAGAPTLIATIRGVGYRFDGD